MTVGAPKVPTLFGILRKTNNRVTPEKAVGSQPGRSKHKSFVMIYFKKGPEFKKKTEQQKAIAAIGKYCGPKIEGKGYVERKKALKACAEEFKNMSPAEIIAEIEERMKKEKSKAK